MKRKFNIFLICVFIFVTTFCFSACDTNDKKREIVNIKDSIAQLTIYTYDGKGESNYGLVNLGHSFLSIYNTSENTIIIGNYNLKPNETICLGTWSILDHFGVWYNVESNYIRVHNKYLGRISVTKYLTNENIDTICEFIANHDYWNPLQNCSYFAINLWNSVAQQSELLDTYLIYSPAKLAGQLKTFENYDVNKSINTSKTFGYFNETIYVDFKLEGDIYV